MIFTVAGILLALCSAGLIYSLLKKGTLYVVIGRRGYLYTAGEPPTVRAGRERLRPAIEGLLEGKRYENLWASFTDNQHQGVALSLDGDAVQLWAMFRAKAELEQQMVLRQAMAERNHVKAQEHPWDQERGPDKESVMIWFQLPKDPYELNATVLAVLEKLQPPGSETLYLRAWKDDAGSMTGSGIAYRRHENPLV